jgi:hypothetical protein
MTSSDSEPGIQKLALDSGSGANAPSRNDSLVPALSALSGRSYRKRDHLTGRPIDKNVSGISAVASITSLMSW